MAAAVVVCVCAAGGGRGNRRRAPEAGHGQEVPVPPEEAVRPMRLRPSEGSGADGFVGAAMLITVPPSCVLACTGMHARNRERPRVAQHMHMQAVLIGGDTTRKGSDNNKEIFCLDSSVGRTEWSRSATPFLTSSAPSPSCSPRTTGSGMILLKFSIRPVSPDNNGRPEACLAPKSGWLWLQSAKDDLFMERATACELLVHDQQQLQARSDAWGSL